MPRGGDLRDYTATDWRSHRTARQAMVDLCVDSGMTREQAEHHAGLGARKLMDDGERGPSSWGGHTGRARHKTPLWGPHAGVLCRIEDDGSLTPVRSSDPT